MTRFDLIAALAARRLPPVCADDPQYPEIPDLADGEAPPAQAGKAAAERSWPAGILPFRLADLPLPFRATQYRSRAMGVRKHAVPRKQAIRSRG